MAYYMFQGRYNADAMKAMVDNPQDRAEGARPLIEALGGKLHHLFFCFGSEDVMALIEAPDDAAMAACALAVGASGSFSGGATTKLISSAEAKTAMATAKKATASYTPATG